MRAVVIHDDVDLLIRRHAGIDAVQEFAEFDRAMTSVRLANHLAALGVARGKHRSRAMTLVIVRAPLTGIVLTVEMTDRGDLTLALLGASLAAMVVAMLLKSEPIYVTLKSRMLEREAAAEPGIADRLTTSSDR